MKASLEGIGQKIDDFVLFNEKQFNNINNQYEKINSHLKELNSQVAKNTIHRHKVIAITKSAMFLVGSGSLITIVLLIV
jgi:hypothetical protein